MDAVLVLGIAAGALLYLSQPDSSIAPSAAPPPTVAPTVTNPAPTTAPVDVGQQQLASMVHPTDSTLKDLTLGAIGGVTHFVAGSTAEQKVLHAFTAEGVKESGQHIKNFFEHIIHPHSHPNWT